MLQKDLHPPQPEPPRRGVALKVFGVIFALLLMVLALTLFWIYGTDTHHANRNSIWWSERGRNLIPPVATDITLRQDFLDHYAIYTISEKTSMRSSTNASLAPARRSIHSVRDRPLTLNTSGRQSVRLAGS